VFTTVLIANRGEIALRVIRTLKRLGIRSVSVHSDADRTARHVFEADVSINIGPPQAAKSYLNTSAILDACARTGAQAIHPGYGFLSENAGFAEAAEAAGIAFIGPTPEQMRKFGLKHTARELAAKAEVPLLPGSSVLADLSEAKREASRIGYPVMLKSSAGGGGIGMQLCRSEAELGEAYDAVSRASRNNFGNASLFLERFVERARHIEVQLFGDGRGDVIALGERDCSAQRRNQKVIEETPAPRLEPEVRAALLRAAVSLGKSVGYRSAGTVEFVYDVDSEQFYFLEVNTRLQVEHPVTEAVTGIDLVEWMVRTAAGEPPDLSPYRSLQPRGHAIEVRVYAEDPAREFKPSAGLLTQVEFPSDVRVDGWIERGTEVSPFYDPMLAKLIVHGADRPAAIAALTKALAGSHIAGITTNLDYLRALARDTTFLAGQVTTAHLKSIEFSSASIEVLSAGTFTLVVDYPGRIGYWDVGIPPSGPMDGRSFRLANRIVGNPESAPGLECTMIGPTLRFSTPSLVALVGARMSATLDGLELHNGEPIAVRAGQTLTLGAISGPGCRSYLAIRSGLDVPEYLGSRSTFTLGRFGGHGGRTLQRGDVLYVGGSEPITAPQPLAPGAHPELADRLDIGVAYGPHGAPDFFTEHDITTLFSTEFEVHYNSARTGIRLIGPKPEWAREDGGDAGLHPSNIHDNAYAVGSIDFTGDMPILLGQDGPSLGGFVCPATIVAAELWKMGQLRPGTRVRFSRLSTNAASALEAAEAALIETLEPPPGSYVPSTRASAGDTPGAGPASSARAPGSDAVLRRVEAIDSGAADPGVAVCYRRAGDKYLLVEYGPLVLDLRLRFRVHSLMAWLSQSRLPGLIDITPGIRSLQIHYDSRVLPEAKLLDALASAERELPRVDDVVVPTRIVHLPLSWDDPQTRLAIQKYAQLVRKDAPWCPSNIEFIRRINGLDSIEDVKRIVFDASYLVLGLGDVYLGAPVATPVDPRHRLVTTKYNPARTWTPENAVGIGGAYMCIYGMEGPGGYQFVGRTLQVFNRFKQTQHFKDGKPWLLRFFDQVRFYPVSAEELLDMREAFPHGKVDVKIEEGSFALAAHERMLESEASSIAAFQSQQRAAFQAERRSWVEKGLLGFSSDAGANPASDGELPAGSEGIEAHVPGSVWKVNIEPGTRVEKGQVLVIVESMKMEISIESPLAGIVTEVLVAEGRAVSAGQRVAVIKTMN
jgi:urea carboxylase